MIARARTEYLNRPAGSYQRIINHQQFIAHQLLLCEFFDPRSLRWSLDPIEVVELLWQFLERKPRSESMLFEHGGEQEGQELYEESHPSIFCSERTGTLLVIDRSVRIPMACHAVMVQEVLAVFARESRFTGTNPSGDDTLTEDFSTFWIFFHWSFSSGLTKVIDLPDLPALPVRPIRWI